MVSSENFDHSSYTDDYLLQILSKVNTIAMVGASPNWKRPSNFAMKYLLQKGFKVIPVNPNSNVKEIFGQKVFPDLISLSEPVDMVDMFRPSQEASKLVKESIEIGAKVFWMQLDITNYDAAKIAEESGLQVVMDRCPKIEYARLFGELGWNGINTGIVTSRRRRLR
tara:strand:- start:395 stop:895 length:501 start_codon:yes stop_codon:yes gene_type:complete